MRRAIKGGWLFLLLLIAPFVLALFFWEFTSKILISDAQAPNDDLLAGAPQTIVESTELIQFDLNGLPAHQLRSDKLLSDEAGGLLYISEPVMGIDPEQSNNWAAQSEQGIYDQHSKILQLRGKVILTKAQPEDAPIIISTEEINYFPDRNFAESNSQVIIETSGHIIETTGISVDFENSVYKLLSNVRGTHEPL